MFLHFQVGQSDGVLGYGIHQPRLEISNRRRIGCERIRNAHVKEGAEIVDLKAHGLAGRVTSKELNLVASVTEFILFRFLLVVPVPSLALLRGRRHKDISTQNILALKV